MFCAPGQELFSSVVNGDIGRFQSALDFFLRITMYLSEFLEN